MIDHIFYLLELKNSIHFKKLVFLWNLIYNCSNERVVQDWSGIMWFILFIVLTAIFTFSSIIKKS